MKIFKAKKKAAPEEEVKTSIQEVSNKKTDMDFEVIEPEPALEEITLPPPPAPSKQKMPTEPDPVQVFNLEITLEQLIKRINRRMRF